MTYNIYIEQFDARYNILDVSESQLTKLIEAYKNGDDSITLDGNKYYMNEPSSFKIFTNKDAKDAVQYFNDLKRAGQATRGLFDVYMSPHQLEYLGENVTNKFIGDIGFGEGIKIAKEKVIQESLSNNYVDLDRIKKLKELTNGYDLKKLIRLCEELNDSYSRQNYYSVGMLVRSIIDHVPPIFKLKTFNEVANNYNDGGKSFGKNMKHLQNSLRNITDGFLHNQIRKKEALPNETQVNFSQDLDVLLSEIIRVS
jgi:hypothetical protein